MSEQEIFDRAHAEVRGLCDGSRRWIMRVPADETQDSDLVISAALTLGESAVIERDGLRVEIAGLRTVCSECARREESLRAEVERLRFARDAAIVALNNAGPYRSRGPRSEAERVAADAEEAMPE